MRKLKFSIQISLDGYFEGPNHELDWSIADDELHEFYVDLLGTADLMLWGRVTYELLRAYWPKASSDPNATQAMVRFANAVNPMRKIVYSKKLNVVDWNSEVSREFNPDAIRKLKAQPGKDILLSGATLAREFMRANLIDEYQLVIMPVAIGSGTALFKGVSIPRLSFLSSYTFKSGAVALRYQPDQSKNT